MKITVRNILQSFAVIAVGASFGCPNAFAVGNNNPPPAGAFIDLGGLETGTEALPVNHGAAVTVSGIFTAALTSTDITLAFREDPAFISLSDVSLIDLTTGSTTNLILNGTFASGSGENPTDWTFANVYGAQASGVVSTSCSGGLTTCWSDGSVQAYDAIDQFVSTTVGQTYQLSFEYSDDGGLGTFSDLSTNGDTTSTGGNGIDILAFAQAGLPPPNGGAPVAVSPEPSSIILAASGLLGAFKLRGRRQA